MKAIGRIPLAIVFLATVGVLTASCTERVIPSSAPAPRPSAPPAPPPPQREVLDWRDAPITPGDWTWTEEPGGSVARFAGGALELRCVRTSGTVTLRRAGAVSASGTNAPVTVATQSVTRTINATVEAGASAGVSASIPARDNLLDAMAFSRGRFAVDVAGLPTLYVPSWPEVSRLVEDCRS